MNGNYRKGQQVQINIHILDSQILPDTITDLIYYYIDGQETEYYQALQDAVCGLHTPAVGAALTSLCKSLGVRATFATCIPAGWPPEERRLAELGSEYVTAALDGDREKCQQYTNEALAIVNADPTQTSQRAGDHLARIIDILVYTLTCALASAETCPEGYDEFVWQQVKAKIGQPETEIDGRTYYAHKFTGPPPA